MTASRHVVGIFLILLNVVSVGCRDSKPLAEENSLANADKPRVVIAASYPLFVVASEIADDTVAIKYPIPVELTSIAWKPTATDVAALQSADAVLLNGAGYEPWTTSVSLPRSRLVDTSAGFADQLLHVAKSVSHQHGPAGEADGKQTVWATWLDPGFFILQVREVQRRIAQLAAHDKDKIEVRAIALISRLEQLNGQLGKLSSHEHPREVLTDGPNYNYLLRRLRWQRSELSVDPDAIDGTIKSIKERPADDRPLVFLHQKGSTIDSAARLEELGIRVVELDVCEHESPGGTLLDRLAANVQRLEDAVGAK